MPRARRPLRLRDKGGSEAPEYPSRSPRLLGPLQALCFLRWPLAKPTSLAESIVDNGRRHGIIYHRF
jgi:hypothetical protein